MNVASGTPRGGGVATVGTRPAVTGKPMPGEHATTVLRPTTWFHAECADCGWRGPARRAESSAQRDGALHALCP